jgi:predicted methyltransferase
MLMAGKWIMALSGAALIAGAALAADTASLPPNIAAAVSNPLRPTQDTQRDANRKPGEVLAFAGVKEGDQIAELVPGGTPRGGYFTRLLSKAAGKDGHVYAFYPTEFDALLAKLKSSIPGEDSNYPNVSIVHQPLASFTAPVPLDLVWTSQNYHDLHDSFAGGLNVGALNKAVFAALKPGGIYLVLDHAAAAGSGLRDTETLHRIDESAVKKEVEAAGFVLEGESDALHNPADPHTAAIFDPAIRGHTDQFILKFRKPK